METYIINIKQNNSSTNKLITIKTSDFLCTGIDTFGHDLAEKILNIQRCWDNNLTIQLINNKQEPLRPEINRSIQILKKMLLKGE